MPELLSIPTMPTPRFPPPLRPTCITSAPLSLRPVYSPSHAPSLLSVSPESSILHPSVLKSFKLALLKGRSSLPAIMSPSHHPLPAPSTSTDLPPLTSSPSPSSSTLPSSTPTLLLSASLPLPSGPPPSSLKRSSSHSDGFPLCCNKRLRVISPPSVPCSCFPLPSEDVRVDEELSAFWIARELVEFASRFDVREEGEEGQERDDETMTGDDRMETEPVTFMRVAVHSVESQGSGVQREDLPDSFPRLLRPDSVETVASVEVGGLDDRDDDTDSEGESAGEVQPWDVAPGVVAAVPALSSEMLAKTLQSSFHALTQQRAESREVAPVKVYAPHPLTLMRAVAQSSGEKVESSTIPSMNSQASAAFSALYSAPALFAFSSALLSSTFTMPPSSPLQLELSTAFAPSTASMSTAFTSYMAALSSSSQQVQSSSLYPPQMGCGLNVTAMSNADPLTPSTSLTFSSPTGSLLNFTAEPQISTVFSL